MDILEETERMCVMRKRYMLLFLAVLLTLLPIPAHAAGEGSVRIDLLGEGVPISGAEIRIYPVGMPTENGYRLTEAFGGGMITQADVFVPELAVWLSLRAGGGLSERTDSSGTAVFWDLDEGLYLVTQPEACGGYIAFDPFLVTIPWDGFEWSITAAPKTERQIEVIPDTSDPGVLDRSLRWLLISGTGLCVLLLPRKRRIR